jgi:hypothetical protein
MSPFPNLMLRDTPTPARLAHASPENVFRAIAAALAARKGAEDPVAAEHIAIDALVHRRAPSAVDPERFAKMTTWGQAVTAFHHCLAGDARGAWKLLKEMRTPDPGLLSWAKSACSS